MDFSNPKHFLEIKQDQLPQHLEDLRGSLAKANPHTLRVNTGTIYLENEPGQGEYLFDLWGETVRLSFPSFHARYMNEQKELSIINQALLLYYFYTADGAQMIDEWISFSELPDGKFYNQAYQGYTCWELKKVFDQKFELLNDRAIKVGGHSVVFADLAFRFRVLPRVDLLLAVWRGDEDLPSSFQILFNSSISHYLPTYVCAIAGSIITRKLISSIPKEIH